MTTAGSGEVKVACDALRADAAVWSQAADAVAEAAQAAQGLTLGTDKLGFAAQQRSVVAAYDALRRKLTALLATGASELGTLGATLHQAADTYEREDRAGAHRIADTVGDK